MEERREVNSKDIIESAKEWFSYFLSKWIWFGAVALICGILAVFYVWSKKPTYNASLNFILSSNSSGSPGLSGLASQFGLDLSSNTDAFSGNNIISLMNSRSMVQKALLQKPADSSKTLLNIFVKDLKMDEGWNETSRTRNSYPFPESADKMNKVQDSLFREIYQSIINNYLSVSKPDKNMSVYVVSTKSNNEIFSLYLTKYLVESTSKFYIDTKTSVARNNLKMLQHEADSIYFILTKSVSSSAKVYDNTFNLNPAHQTQRVPAQQSQITATALTTAYGEVLRNLELAKINLQKETPLYQIIDEPQLPLVAEKTSRIIALLAGGCIGVFLMMIFLVAINLLKLNR